MIRYLSNLLERLKLKINLSRHYEQTIVDADSGQIIWRGGARCLDGWGLEKVTEKSTIAPQVVDYSVFQQHMERQADHVKLSR